MNRFTPAALAARLCAAAACLRKRADTQLPDSERQAFEQVLVGVRTSLGQLAFSREWALGAGFSQDEAIAFALSALI
jgi:hypothetical protein